MGMLINIDNGGTLTDICVIDGTQVYHTKTVTTPYDLSQCFVEGLKKASKVIYGEERLTHLLKETDYIRYSTTQGTNALVERKGPRIGVVLADDGGDGELADGSGRAELVRALIGDRIARIDQSLEGDAYEQEVVRVVNSLAASGAARLVIALDGPNSAREEKRFRRVLLTKFHRHRLGAVPALFTHEVSDDPVFGRRLWTAVFNSFLHPSMERFLFNAGHLLRSYRFMTPLLIFRNDGDSARVAKTIAIKTYSSGPQGGAEGTRAFAEHYGLERILSMDIGGTTTDVGLVEGGQIRTKRRGEIEGVPVSFPLSDIVSYGVGGSSIIRVAEGAIRVGPESVGGAPGPACFGQGGKEVTMTDALVVMGVLDPDSYFGGGLRLDAERAAAVVDAGICAPLGLPRDKALLAVEAAWVEAVADGLKNYTDLSKPLTLLAFGGAGTMAISAIADRAGISRVAIPKHAAVFSAFGIGFSDIAHHYETTLSSNTAEAMGEARIDMQVRARRDMFAEGFALDQCEQHFSLRAVRNGTERDVAFDATLPLPPDCAPGDEISVGLRVVKSIAHARFVADRVASGQSAATRNGSRRVLTQQGWQEIPLYLIADQPAGAGGMGPAILEDPYFTCRILAGWRFEISECGDIFLNKIGGGDRA